MRRNIFGYAILAIIVSGLSLMGCGPSGKVAALVNGHVITVKDVEDRLASMNPNNRAMFSENKSRLLDQMVMEAVLVQESKKRGLEQDREVHKLLKEAEHQILIGRLLDLYRKESKAQVTDEQIAQFYESNRSSFQQPESYRASHILVPDEETAKKALERVKAGEPFAKVAEEMSTDPSKSHGGDIGFFAKGQVIPEFEAVCAKLKPGELSEVVKTPLGYHVILLTEQKAARQKPLEEVKDQIRQGLEGQQGQRQVEGFVQQLRSKAQIKIRENFSAPVPAAGKQTAASPQQPSS